MNQKGRIRYVAQIKVEIAETIINVPEKRYGCRLPLLNEGKNEGGNPGYRDFAGGP